MIELTKEQYRQYKQMDVKVFYKKQLQNKDIYNPVLGKILFTQKGLGETIHRTKRKFHPFICILKELVESAQCDGKLQPLYKPRKDRIIGFYHLKNKIKLCFIDIAIDILIAQDQDGNKYYMFKKDPQSNLGEDKSSQRGLSESNYIITEIVEKSTMDFENDFKNIKQGQEFWIGDTIQLIIEKMDIKEQLAYHGTDKQFDKFDLDKFQRGDYGYGIYFTHTKSYAADYGNVNQYDIPESEYLLDWENSYYSQSNYIINCLDNLLDDLYEQDAEFYDYLIELIEKYNINSGGAIYRNLGRKFSAKQISELMYKHGIKGIESLTGDCIVIFNPDDIKQNEFAELNEQLVRYLEDVNRDISKDLINLD